MGKSKRIFDTIDCDNRIIEMMQDNSLINVPIHNNIDISTITTDDPDPKFVNVEVIRAGTSKSNNRRYNNNIVREINDLIPGLQGFLGHPDPAKFGFEFREPQCIFVGSSIEEMVDGLHRCIAKCYLFKTSPLREWIPKSIAAGNPMTVSINGSGDVVRNGDVVDVLHMTELQSIDWANPGTEGMYTSKAMSVVQEIQNNLEDDDMDTKDIIKNSTVTEFKAYNPDGFAGVISAINLQELQSNNPNLYNQIVDSAKISEMQLTIGGENKSVKLTELQGVISKFESDMSSLNVKIQNDKLTEFKKTKLAEMVPEKMREKIASKITGSTEADIENSIKAEIDYIREMGGSVDNLPVGRHERVMDEDMKDSIQKLFGVKATK